MAVFGYIPEYRFSGLDWHGVVRSTSHLVLFSAQPTAEGDLDGLDRLSVALRVGSALRTALDQQGEAAPKVLVAIGGAGRSQHFAAAAGSSKTRKRLAKVLAKFFAKFPFLSGVDLDWETPQSSHQWRDLGRLAKEIRSTLSEVKGLLITTTYHPRSGAVNAFSGLKGKKSETSFVDLFDFCHAMAYSLYDNERRHSSPKLDGQAIEEWMMAGLPMPRLTLGLPFFGVSRRTGEAKTYSQILDQEPSLTDRPGTDESKDGDYFINARSMAQKVRVAAENGLGGVMVWELGQDKAVSSGSSLLEHVWAAAKHGLEPPDSWKEALLTRIHNFNEDHVIGTLASILGGYFMIKALTGERARDKLQPPPRPQPKQTPAVANVAGAAGEGAAAEGAGGRRGAGEAAATVDLDTDRESGGT